MTGAGSSGDARPILVTGCPRSGTTWVGNIIGAARDVFSVYEPFNDDVGAHLHLPERFMHLTDSNAAPFRKQIDQLVSLGKLPDRAALALVGTAERWKPGPKRATPARLAARRLLRHRKDFIGPKRVCLKDPLAFFSSEWLAETYDAQVVIMLRHPCGVAASYLSLGWDSEIDAIIDRLLPADATTLRDRIAEFKTEPRTIVGDLILQWQIFTTLTLDFHRRHPDWIVLIHDEFAQRPRDYFDAVFRHLELDLTPTIADRIEQESTADAKSGGSAIQHSHARDSRSIVEAWRKKIEPEIADRILEETGTLWIRAQREISPLCG